jgi:hypothetical protein
MVFVATRTKAFPLAAIGKEKQNFKDQLFESHATPDSKRQKLKWAFGTKAKRVAQVEQFSSLVESLFEEAKNDKGKKSTRGQ